LDVNQERFMHVYEPDKAELASRDVVSRWMMHHIREGKGVPSPYGPHLWLDIRHLGEKHITTRLREVYDTCLHFLGVNPIHQLIPVRPCQHYSMGGVRTNKDGHAYGLKGLFSAGESACWDMHGFNRLGGNSLAETIVAGRHIGMRLVEFLQGAEATLRTDLARQAVALQQERIGRIVRGADGKESVYDIRNAMQKEMMEGVGIFRNGADLQKAVDNLRQVYARSRQVALKSNGLGASPELALAIKIAGTVRLAICVAYAALQRTESRGAHAREDYLARNDRDWLSRTLAYWRDPEGDLPSLEYEPATPVFHLPPGDRGYGKCEIICAEEMGD
jgi:fumarate reductase flavoprotein subunit